VEELQQDSTNWSVPSSTNNAATKSAAASPDTNSPLQMVTFASNAHKVRSKTNSEETDASQSPAQVKTQFSTHLTRKCAEDVRHVNCLTSFQTEREILVSREFQTHVLALKDRLPMDTHVKNAHVDTSKAKTTSQFVSEKHAVEFTKFSSHGMMEIAQHAKHASNHNSCQIQKGPSVLPGHHQLAHVWKREQTSDIHV
jgi:hypothetical protein